MRALWDFPELPYRAVAPWPRIERLGQQDWIEQVMTVEQWLELHVGPHYARWGWSMWTLHNQHDLCAVSFAREQDTTLFLLRWA
jgi:hypothetical protein